MQVDKSELDRLRAAARKASEHARAPYSGYRVGAVVVDASGSTYPGCNVENASFSLTSCAERNALAAAIVAGAERPHTLLIYTPGSAPWPPCGGCRQVIAELMAPDGRVMSSCDEDDVRFWSVDELLPDRFGWPAS